ncbi:GH14317 [Drosophila grimshawi]|uniref:GH14317 n=2 Tax=Drosophila grimshawi TaxID=7222 RepID=B4JYL4_DROGR|nr:GH14317 [Drosophila grimshawi]
MTSRADAWQLPRAKDVQHSLESCHAEQAGEDAATLRCLVDQLGLWTDELGYNARRITKIFAAYNQMEELILVIDYCNSKERREKEPAQWAYNAYKCATSGRFGEWVNDYYVKQLQAVKSKPESRFDED